MRSRFTLAASWYIFSFSVSKPGVDRALFMAMSKSSMFAFSTCGWRWWGWRRMALWGSEMVRRGMVEVVGGGTNRITQLLLRLRNLVMVRVVKCGGG